jgi:hypothetical protein
VVTGGWITQAAILAAHPDLPVIAWSVTASGGALSGQVLVPAAGRRGLFGQWRHALRLGNVTETPTAGRTAVYLHASGICGGVPVSVTATVFDDKEDDR